MQIRGQLESGSVLGGYRIDEMISRGGMGMVYRATHIALNRVYALKVLAPELASDEQFRQRFGREMRIAASLHHPHVVGIHYAGEHDGALYFVMDFVAGTDLREVIRKSGALEPSRASGLVAQVASALDAAHGRGLVHRDVKPANILLTVRDGEEYSYLADFGLAKKYDTVSDVTGLTAMGAVVGTVDYMAPEQVTGAHTDARTDIYALGCVFFQMLTGQVPYIRDNSVATLYAHVHEPPPPLLGTLADLYPTFGPVIDKAMAKDPADRFVSAGDFARDVAAALSGARYRGAPTLVATGEAAPLHIGQDAAQSGLPDSNATQLTPDATRAHVETEPPSALAAVTRAAADVAQATSPGPAAATAPVDGGQGPVRTRRGRYRWLALPALLIVGGVIAAVIVSSSGSSSPPGSRFAAALDAVPTNRVTGSGSATIELRGKVATITVDTNGLLPAVHLMHIHGGTGTCPTSSVAGSFQGHQFISASKGDRSYGAVVTSLTQFGDTSAPSHLATSRFPAVGNIRYKREFSLAPNVVTLIHQGLAVIVLHGIDYNGNGSYDSFLGPDAEAAAPALCGVLLPTQSVAERPAADTIYTASLALERGSAQSHSPRLALLCHVGRPHGAPVLATTSKFS
jgi:hypothetical protein